MNVALRGDREFFSYLTLRRAVGVMGVLLPIVLLVGHIAFSGRFEIIDSISGYYDTAMGDVFVGTLFAVGWFLFSYRGYDRTDDLVGDLAWLFSLGVALFPTTSANPWISGAHFVFAALMFSVLSYFALFLFTKSDAATKTPAKEMRNKVYVTCGVIMLVCIVLIALFKLSPLEAMGIANVQPVFWLESIALWAFGVSWFVKGETILRDR